MAPGGRSDSVCVVFTPVGIGSEGVDFEGSLIVGSELLQLFSDFLRSSLFRSSFCFMSDLYLMMIDDKSLTESLREIVLLERALTSSLREPTVISIASVTAILIAFERLSAMLAMSGVFDVGCC